MAKPAPLLVWVIGILMVTVVSLCSLVGVSIVPLISGKSYQVFITLFTGLAVGSLVGSAIFNLIPQAFNLHLQPDRAYLWRSLVIFGGIYLFYISERIMRYYFEVLPNSRSKNSSPVDETELNDIEPVSLKHSSKDAGDSSKNIVKENPLIAKDKESRHDIQHVGHSHEHENTQEIIVDALKKEERGLARPSRQKIAPVAWMIIIGDGIHNFIDGLSIGAAFSESITLGLTTSLAVIFEELPHELGDFAVLISSGMTVRQALSYNFISACTCYIGLIFGILLGDLTASASYIFALAGGMFLYISLVDMMGEMGAMLEKHNHSPKKTSHLLLMQNVGLLTGICIIFGLSWVNLE